MIRIVTPLAVLTITLALSLPARAGSLTRTFVSSAGSDSNPCTITQPCASFKAAYNAVQANGIIAALDPGKYGFLNVNMPLTINGNGWAAITAPAGADGIDVNSSGNVTLIGLEIDGAGAGAIGIWVGQGTGSVTITNCTVQNFVVNNSVPYSGNGIVFQPASLNSTLDFTITNTTVANNQNVGIFYDPVASSSLQQNANGIIDHVVASNNATGIDIQTVVQMSGTTIVNISNSITSNSSETGIFASNDGAPGTIIELTIDNVTAGGNNNGVFVKGTTSVQLGHSDISGNTTGVFNNTSPNSFYTFRDNHINFNGTNIFGGSLNGVSLQ
jgi:hypothetical protein